MREVHIPGLALGIVRGDQVIHLRGFGGADPAGREVTPQTPFILAWASKSFTALAVMQLVEDGTVEFDALVNCATCWATRAACPRTSLTTRCSATK